MPAAVPLFGYQQRWFLDRSRFKIGMFARQTGKTFTTTLELVDDALSAAAEGRRSDWVILSRGERQAKEAMVEGVKKHCKAYQAGFDSIDDGIWKGSEATYTMHEVTLPGGSRITALPANPDTARGFSRNVFLDEFAIHRDSREIWGALFPVISAGYKLRVTSTPKGKGNKFYELMTGRDRIWNRHTVDIYQAVADGLPRNVEELRAALNDEDLWAQEFELAWLDEASAWLDYDLIMSVEHPDAGDDALYGGTPCYVGNDIGRRNDLWVAWVWEQVGDVLWTRQIRILRRKSFAEQDAALDDIVQRYKVARLCMDQTGMGEKPVEDAQRRYGEYRVEGVLFTAPSKQLLATLGKQAFQDRRVRIPAGDTSLRSDLHQLRKDVTPLGTVRFLADHESNGHADRTWAAFLGIYAAHQGPIEYGYYPVPKRGLKDDPLPRPVHTGRTGIRNVKGAL